jgi:hypothetical protein
MDLLLERDWSLPSAGGTLTGLDGMLACLIAWAIVVLPFALGVRGDDEVAGRFPLGWSTRGNDATLPAT